MQSHLKRLCAQLIPGPSSAPLQSFFAFHLRRIRRPHRRACFAARTMKHRMAACTQAWLNIRCDVVASLTSRPCFLIEHRGGIAGHGTRRMSSDSDDGGVRNVRAGLSPRKHCGRDQPLPTCGRSGQAGLSSMRALKMLSTLGVIVGQPRAAEIVSKRSSGSCGASPSP